MVSDELVRHFFGGFVRLHILHHAAEGQVCGIEMIDELARHGYSLSPGTLYPIFHSLEEGGYLSGEDAVVRGKRRRYYRATRQGEQLLREARTKLQELFHELVEERKEKGK